MSLLGAVMVIQPLRSYSKCMILSQVLQPYAQVWYTLYTLNCELCARAERTWSWCSEHGWWAWLWWLTKYTICDTMPLAQWGTKLNRFIVLTSRSGAWYLAIFCGYQLWQNRLLYALRMHTKCAWKICEQPLLSCNYTFQFEAVTHAYFDVCTIEKWPCFRRTLRSKRFHDVLVSGFAELTKFMCRNGL